MYNEDTVKDVHKDDHEVFWRWFYVSNWGSLRTAPRKDYQKHIAQGLSFYGAEFWEKACGRGHRGQRRLALRGEGSQEAPGIRGAGFSRFKRNPR